MAQKPITGLAHIMGLAFITALCANEGAGEFPPMADLTGAALAKSDGPRSHHFAV